MQQQEQVWVVQGRPLGQGLKEQQLEGAQQRQQQHFLVRLLLLVVEQLLLLLARLPLVLILMGREILLQVLRQTEPEALDLGQQLKKGWQRGLHWPLGRQGQLLLLE